MSVYRKKMKNYFVIQATETVYCRLITLTYVRDTDRRKRLSFFLQSRIILDFCKLTVDIQKNPVLFTSQYISS